MTIAPPAPSLDQARRSAGPPRSLSNRSDEHFHAALEAGSRADASLSELARLVSGLTGGLAGAQKANQQLVQELGTLRAMLGSANEQQLALHHRLALLEQELTLSQSAAERERQFLTDQQDEFLAALLEEHDEALSSRVSQEDTLRVNGDVADLVQQLVRAESARVAAEGECARAREASLKAQAQRDEAQSRAAKRERERDELRAEASQLRARLGTHKTASTTPPPPSVTNRPPSFRPAALQLDAAELDSNLRSGGSSPRLASVKPRLTSPPAELAGAVYTPSPASVRPEFREPAAPAAASPPTAQPFPRESTRPGVGGPKAPAPPSFGPPPSGWTPPPPAPEPTEAPRAALVSAASLPPGLPSAAPILKQKPHPTTRPLFDYSLGGDRVPSETLEGVRLSSKPPKK